MANKIKYVYLLLALSLWTGWTPETVVADESRPLHIFIDPAFGGKEKGPVINQKFVAKDLTLSIGRQLKTLLELKGYLVTLSREGDQFVSPDERLTQAIAKNSDLFISIKINRQRYNCAQLYYAKQPQVTTATKEGGSIKDLDESLRNISENLERDNLTKESLKLAEIVSNKLKDNKTQICDGVLTKKDYILENTRCPTIVIDFGASDLNSASLYIVDTSFMDRITKAIAGGVEKYLETAIPQFSRQPIHQPEMPIPGPPK